jgi:hypothetical protein
MNEVKIFSEKGGLLRLNLLFKTFHLTNGKNKFSFKENILVNIFPQRNYLASCNL